MPISYMVLSSSGRSLPFPRNGWADKREQGCHTKCKTLTLPIASANSVSIDHWSGWACCCFHIHIESMNKIKTEKDYTPLACPWKLLSQVKYMSSFHHDVSIYIVYLETRLSTKWFQISEMLERNKDFGAKTASSGEQEENPGSQQGSIWIKRALGSNLVGCALARVGGRGSAGA